MTKAEITEKELVLEGWKYDHQAMSKGYHPAGSVQEMASRGEYDYCRVFTSECHGTKNYQVTYVYKRRRDWNEISKRNV